MRSGRFGDEKERSKTTDRPQINTSAISNCIADAPVRQRVARVRSGGGPTSKLMSRRVGAPNVRFKLPRRRRRRRRRGGFNLRVTSPSVHLLHETAVNRLIASSSLDRIDRYAPPDFLFHLRVRRRCGV